MAWIPSPSANVRIPPMGQGLAVLAALAGVAILSIGGVAGYLFSLHTASWNSQNRALDAQIFAKQQEVRRLGYELEFRSRFPELERWSDPLGLQPADGRQYGLNVRQIDMLAAARNQHIADQLPRVGGAKGYTPQARDQIDTLIDKVATN